jgi:hypothetical protein
MNQTCCPNDTNLKMEYNAHHFIDISHECIILEKKHTKELYR